MKIIKKDSGIDLPHSSPLVVRLQHFNISKPLNLKGKTYAEQCLLVEYAALSSYSPTGVYLSPITPQLLRFDGVIFPEGFCQLNLGMFNINGG